MITKKEREEIETDILVIYNNLYHVLHGADIEEGIKDIIRGIVKGQKERLLKKHDLSTILKIAKGILNEEEYAEFETFMSE